jgi:predicted HicB family RNase H-like nuclease
MRDKGNRLMTSDTARSATLNVRLSPALKARFEKLAARDQRTLSNYVEIVLRTVVDDLEAAIEKAAIEKKHKPTRR